MKNDLDGIRMNTDSTDIGHVHLALQVREIFTFSDFRDYSESAGSANLDVIE